MDRTVDIAIVGSGAAGLFAGIWAGRAGREGRVAGERPDASGGAPLSIVALDGAKKLGAKILVAGGGRCNVTHHAVDEQQYAGSSRNAVKKVLRRFDVARTVEFFAELGVGLKREATGKLFPTSDDAQTVLDALLGAARAARVELVYPWRVCRVARENGVFAIEGDDPAKVIWARRVILATGGMALPKTGSDGLGYRLAKALGHTMTPRIFPALVPLTIPSDHWICQLSGISLETTLEVRAGSGKRMASFTNSTLLTHFGLSGPGPLDVSRYYSAARHDDGDARLVINWLPGVTREAVDAELLALGARSAGRWLRERGLSERLAEALCRAAGVDASAPGHALTREKRRELTRIVSECEVPVSGDRGFAHAEVTAGGVPLAELHLDTMQSRVCPGLYLCGELCDVDGRIGGFNFQWAWASGFVAGSAAAESLRVEGEALGGCAGRVSERLSC